MFLKKKRNNGVSLVEVVIASSIISIALLVLVSVYSAVARYSLSNVRTLKATQLVEEGIEVLQYLRDSGYTKNIASLTNGNAYHLYWDANVNGGTWTATTSNILLENRYQINFVLSPVSRDTNFNVVSSGGTVDTGSKKATVSVSWRESAATSTKSAETYLFNIFNN
ncbi:MAG: prepilin-type N-terminal cleavage/methylation domain-containing protein [Patescibacteria group bacterium]